MDFRGANRFLVFLFLLFAGMYFARGFLVPVVLAILFAMLMAGLAARMEAKGMSRGLSTVICTLILVVVFIGSFYFLTDEVAEFAGSVPSLKQRTEENITQAQVHLKERWGISYERQAQLLKSRSSSVLDSLGSIVQKLLEMIASLLRNFVLITVYVFLMLLYRDKFHIFILKLVPDSKHEHARAIVHRCTDVAEKYLLGKLLLVFILFAAYAAGYKLVGLDNALFLAMIAAALSIIPIVGTLVGGLIPVVIAFISQSPAVGLGAIIVFLVAQIMENYVLTPLVVGSKVNLNPLFTIMAVILGGILWGAIGMIVFIPLLGIVKIICDNIPSLEPLGFLVGKEPQQRRLSIIDKMKKRFSRGRSAEEA